ncbi:hypothetical protein C7Y46_16770 [Bacillus safensis]|nr:hypothetical protein KU48_16405 [Bacillus safensis]TQR22919.1 hypothetical protein C7Y46_16770 [Bacillus sp. SDF0016]
MKTNKTVICAITKKDLYVFFFCDLFMATLVYYVFKFKPTTFYECAGVMGSILCPFLMKKWIYR